MVNILPLLNVIIWVNLAQQVVGEEIRVLAGMALMLFVVFMMYGIGVMIRLLTQMYLLGEIQILYVRQIKLIMSHEIIEL